MVLHRVGRTAAVVSAVTLALRELIRLGGGVYVWQAETAAELSAIVSAVQVLSVAFLALAGAAAGVAVWSAFRAATVPVWLVPAATGISWLAVGYQLAASEVVAGASAFLAPADARVSEAMVWDAVGALDYWMSASIGVLGGVVVVCWLAVMLRVLARRADV